jgi:hypothetical protein
MPPFVSLLLRRDIDPRISSGEFSQQWMNPSDIFSVLLLLGGGSDPVGRALAQLAGSRVTPVAFSFGTLSRSIPSKAFNTLTVYSYVL